MLRMLVVLLALVADGKDDPSAKDREAMQGDWACDAFTRDGTRLEDDDAQAYFRTVKGNTYTVSRYRNKIGEGTFTLDATKSPPWIDLTPKGPKQLVVIRGIYKLEKGILTICYAPPGKDRPTTFDAREGSGHTLNVWKKEKK